MDALGYLILFLVVVGQFIIAYSIVRTAKNTEAILKLLTDARDAQILKEVKALNRPPPVSN